MDAALKRIPLRTDEEVRATVRRHGARLARPLAIAGVILLTALFFMYPLVARGPIGASIFAALMLTALVYASREATMWYYTIAIITTQRVIDVDKKGYFTRIVSEAPLGSITDVSYSTRGIGQTVFGSGTIVIKTSQNALTLALEDVQDPERVSALVHDLIRAQTGRNIEVRREKSITPRQKQELISDVMESEDLQAYSDYDLDELVAEYTEMFGEDKLKKLLVDELDAHDDEKL